MDFKEFGLYYNAEADRQEYQDQECNQMPIGHPATGVVNGFHRFVRNDCY